MILWVNTNTWTTQTISTKGNENPNIVIPVIRRDPNSNHVFRLSQKPMLSKRNASAIALTLYIYTPFITITVEWVDRLMPSLLRLLFPLFTIWSEYVHPFPAFDTWFIHPKAWITPTSLICSRLDAFDACSLRKILWIPYSRGVTNAEVRVTAGCKPDISVVLDRKLRLFGHVARCQSNHDHRQPVAAAVQSRQLTGNGHELNVATDCWRLKDILASIQPGGRRLCVKIGVE